MTDVTFFGISVQTLCEYIAAFTVLSVLIECLWVVIERLIQKISISPVSNFLAITRNQMKVVFQAFGRELEYPIKSPMSDLVCIVILCACSYLVATILAFHGIVYTGLILTAGKFDYWYSQPAGLAVCTLMLIFTRLCIANAQHLRLDARKRLKQIRRKK